MLYYEKLIYHDNIEYHIRKRKVDNNFVFYFVIGVISFFFISCSPLTKKKQKIKKESQFKFKKMFSVHNCVHNKPIKLILFLFINSTGHVSQSKSYFFTRLNDTTA